MLNCFLKINQYLLWGFLNTCNLCSFMLASFHFFSFITWSGLHCETISECSVTCPHGRCTHRPDVCECETNWGPEGQCTTYTGLCVNCSSVGGTCEEGPNTCKCKPGLNLCNFNCLAFFFLFPYLLRTQILTSFLPTLFNCEGKRKWNMVKYD